MADHTQGRLLAATNYAQPELRDEAGNLVAVVAAYQPQDALRLAACWNACNGLHTEALSRGEPLAFQLVAALNQAHAAGAQRDELLRARQVLGAERISLEAQRDELLDILKLCEGNISSLLAAKHPMVFGEWLQVVRTAIAKHQPPAGTPGATS